MTRVAYRAATEADRRFITDSWCGSYRDAFTAGLIQVEDWYAVMIPQITKVLAKPEVRAVVAHAPGDADGVADLLGFVVADPSDDPALVYYVFVKPHYRRARRLPGWSGAGIGRGLLGAIGIDPGRPFNYVCSTPAVRLLERKIPMARWRPLLGRFPKSERRAR